MRVYRVSFAPHNRASYYFYAESVDDAIEKAKNWEESRGAKTEDRYGKICSVNFVLETEDIK
jgi:hypothetical protein